MTATRVEIDPNFRVRGNRTWAPKEAVTGSISVNDAVTVYESEANIVGDGVVEEIDARGVVLAVDWSSLRAAASE